MKKEPSAKKITAVIPLAVYEALRTSAQAQRRSFNKELVWALESYLRQQSQPPIQKP